MPSDAEWIQMEVIVGLSQSVALNTGFRGEIAARLSGGTGWQSSTATYAPGNTSALGRNSSGFSALPAGGNFMYSGGYSATNFGYEAVFWSATESDSSNAWLRHLYYSNPGVYRGSQIKAVFNSVRCVRD